MGYVDAGYAVALSALALYAVSLWQRRARLEKIAARMRNKPGTGSQLGQGR